MPNLALPKCTVTWSVSQLWWCPCVRVYIEALRPPTIQTGFSVQPETASVSSRSNRSASRPWRRRSRRRGGGGGGGRGGEVGGGGGRLLLLVLCPVIPSPPTPPVFQATRQGDLSTEVCVYNFYFKISIKLKISLRIENKTFENISDHPCLSSHPTRWPLTITQVLLLHLVCLDIEICLIRHKWLNSCIGSCKNQTPDKVTSNCLREA